MKIMGMDISKTRTGWAVWDTQSHISSIRCGSFKSEGDTLLAATASYLPQLIALIKTEAPGYVAFEEGVNFIKNYVRVGSDLAGGFSSAGGNSDLLILQRLLGSTQAVLTGMKIQHESVDQKTWRKAFLGYGVKKGMKTDDYKRAARQQCEIEGIAVKNGDQAEAAGVAFWAGRCSQKVKEMTMRAAA